MADLSTVTTVKCTAKVLAHPLVPAYEKVSKSPIADNRTGKP